MIEFINYSYTFISFFIIKYLLLADDYLSRFEKFVSKNGVEAIASAKQNIAGVLTRFICYHNLIINDLVINYFGRLWNENNRENIKSHIISLYEDAAGYFVSKKYLDSDGKHLKEWEPQLNDNFGVSIPHNPSSTTSNNTDSSNSNKRQKPSNFSENPKPPKRPKSSHPISNHNISGLGNGNKRCDIDLTKSPSQQESSNETIDDNNNPLSVKNGLLKYIQEELNIHDLIQFERILKKKEVTNFIMDQVDPPARSISTPNHTAHYSKQVPSKKPHSMPVRGYPDSSEQAQSLTENMINQVSKDEFADLQSRVNALQSQLNSQVPPPSISSNPHKWTLEEMMVRPSRGLDQLGVDFNRLEHVVARANAIVREPLPDKTTHRLNKILNQSTNKELTSQLQGLISLSILVLISYLCSQFICRLRTVYL